MVQKPQFKSHFRVEIVEGDGVFLLSEKKQVVLQGRLYELVAPWIDGARSAHDIVDRLADEASAAEVYHALIQLEKNGYIRENESTLSPGQAALWDIQDIPPAEARRRLAETVVSVTAFGVDSGPFVAMLGSAGVRAGKDGQLGVVLTDDYLRGALNVYNQDALDRRRPWLLMRPVGTEVLIGPLFRPGTTGCWVCLAQRLRGHREIERYVQDRKKGAEPFPVARGFTPVTQALAWSLGANEVVGSIVRGAETNVEGKVLSFDVLTGTAQTHVLVRRPQCSACGDRESYASQQWKAPVLDEGSESSEPADHTDRAERTLRRLMHHVSPITGAVRSLAPCENPDEAPIHLYAAVHSFGAQHTTLEALTRSLHISSAGKGTTDLQARVGALCESLERYSGDFRGEEARLSGSLRQLGAAAIHPNACMLFSEQQFREREALNAGSSWAQSIPVPFDEDAQIEWTPVWSLTAGQFRYVPTAFCYYNYPGPRESTYCVGCSNGNAAGTTIEDAMLRGFLELVERDSVAIWWYNRLRMPGVSLESFDDQYLNRLARFLRARHVDFWVLDITMDLDIPTFAALSRRAAGPSERIMMGFGAHLDPRTAIVQAVLELNQMNQVAALFLDTADAARAGAHSMKPEIVTWLQTATLETQAYLGPHDGTPLRQASDYARSSGANVRSDLQTCRELVEQRGLEMLVLEQTRPDLQLPVVKVIVPGLRHFWPRFAPGRLYDVPVRRGLLGEPLTERQLNPIAMFL